MSPPEWTFVNLVDILMVKRSFLNQAHVINLPLVRANLPHISRKASPPHVARAHDSINHVAIKKDQVRPMKTLRLPQTMMTRFIAYAVMITCQGPAIATEIFHEWTPAPFNGSTWDYSNTSGAGTITGSSPVGGFAPYPPGCC